MAVEQSEVSADAEAEALFKKAMRMLAQAQQTITEAAEIIKQAHTPPRARRSALDANGEPTWVYLVKVKIPKDIRVTKAFAEYAAGFGLTAEQAEILMSGKAGSTYEGFRAYYERVGTKWQDWTRVWQKWVRNENDRKKARDAGRASKFDQQRTRY